MLLCRDFEIHQGLSGVWIVCLLFVERCWRSSPLQTAFDIGVGVHCVVIKYCAEKLFRSYLQTRLAPVVSTW